MAMAKWLGKAAACNPVMFAAASRQSAPSAAAAMPRVLWNRQKNIQAAPAWAAQASSLSRATETPASSA